MLLIVRNELRTVRIDRERFSFNVRQRNRGKWKRVGGKAHVTEKGSRFLDKYSLKIESGEDALFELVGERYRSMEKVIKDPAKAREYFEFSPYRETYEEAVCGDNNPQVMQKEDIDSMIFVYTGLSQKRDKYFGQRAIIYTWCFEAILPKSAALRYLQSSSYLDGVQGGRLVLRDRHGEPVSGTTLCSRLLGLKGGREGKKRRTSK